MRKTLLALTAVAALTAGTMTAPKPAHATNGLAVAAIVAGAVVVTYVLFHGIRPAHAYKKKHRKGKRR